MKNLLTKLLSGAFWIGLFINFMNSEYAGPVFGIGCALLAIFLFRKIMKKNGWV